MGDPRKRQQQLQIRQVDDWNEKWPVGTPVAVTKDDGKVVHTSTRSEAWMLGADQKQAGHTAVVLVDGISGAYLLSRVVPLRVVGQEA